MRVGYACTNLTVDCTSSGTFRLDNYSDERLIETVDENLNCLKKILEFNCSHNLLFFRISSDLVPFASHSVNEFPWQKHFANNFSDLGSYIKENGMRVSMHPDQFILINTNNMAVLHGSIRELVYHAEVLELMGLDHSHKIQIHIGGGYGDKRASIGKFIEEYKNLPEMVKNRLVIENDDRIFTLNNCLAVFESMKIPVVFDYLHHNLNNDDGGDYSAALGKAIETWGAQDGLPIVDFSSQSPSKRPGAHAESIDLREFERFYEQTKDYNYDLMLEVKDKEKSALKVRNFLSFRLNKDR